MTFSPEMERRTEAFALTALFLAAIASVVVFFPAEGRVLAPVHQGLSLLLGQTTFVVPLALAVAATLAFARRARPSLVLPYRRLAGLGAITFALLPAEHLLGQSTGLVGEWFTGVLIGVAGGPFTV
ncbi:MAG TPA: hypothetical protein VFB50_18325, partial [Chloroflexota bacterium]|nr:hypothetical protein [Chloroflexota bacterium]